MEVEEALLLYCLIKRKRKNNKRKRLHWVHPIVGARLEKGNFNILFPDLLKYESKFFNFFRMSSKSYFELHNLIKDDTTKEDTNMRRSISTEERLAVTLRVCQINLPLHPLNRNDGNTTSTSSKRLLSPLSPSNADAIHKKQQHYVSKNRFSLFSKDIVQSDSSDSNQFDTELEKIISYSTDNMNTNFGGLQRKGKNNVFIKLKETLNREILGMGCYAHIIHNSIQCASDCLPIDIESIVCKIFGFFHIYTVRVENLKEFCDFADVQYKGLLSHSKTRWLSLFLAIERIISIYNGLKSYFLSQNTCPNALKIFFENESSLLWLKFLSSQLKTINSYIKKVESQKLSAIELTIIMEDLMQKIENKRQEKFLTTEIENLVTKFEDEGLINRKDFENKCDEFYALCYNYLKNWNNSNQHVNQLKSMLWITLTPKTIVTWENVKKSVQFINNVMSKPNSVTFDEETFFEQFKTFEKIFHQQNDEWHHQDIEDKWLFIFKTFADNNQEFSMLLKVVEFSFVLPGSNAAVERVFSLMNNTWTNLRNKLDIKTVEASLIIKTSFNNTSCEVLQANIGKQIVTKTSSWISQIFSFSKIYRRNSRV
ncbi:hypothetical protein QTP88_011002 [Uroleucon formosanum]